jgi:HK97 family phage prohead protease
MTISRNTPAKGVAMMRATTIEKDASEGARRFRFVASDETVDRYGDIIRASGWQLDNYRKNPQLLYGHMTRELPLGRVEPIAVEGTKLIAHAEFAPEGISAFADTVCAMVNEGILVAMSVGFMPLADPTPIFDANKQLTGFEFNGQELLENSIVTVPANPNALQLAKSFPLTDEERQVLFTQEPDRSKIAALQRRTLINDLRYRRVI